jgi:hypothetical protein
MEMRYAVHGLHLTSDFPLPGAKAVGENVNRHPRLTLRLQRPSELDQAWSGADGPSEWRGRLGDGCDLVIDRGVDGDVLFSYGERAAFRLHTEMTFMDCAPSGSGLDWQRALISKVLPSISVMRGYEALHAAVVDSPHGVVALMGPSGVGKSTLAAEFLRRGHALFADDQLTLGRSGDAVCGHHGTSHMNLARDNPSVGFDPRSLGAILGVLGGELWLTVDLATERSRPVALLCMIERGAGLPLEAKLLPGNPLALAPYMLGLSVDAERERSRFCLYADLMESAGLLRLTAGSGDRPDQLADLIERTLTCLPQGAGAPS